MKSNKNTKQEQALDELGRKVHELRYAEPLGAKRTSPKPDRLVAKELAAKIRKNIESYQKNVDLSQHSHFQTQ